MRAFVFTDTAGEILGVVSAEAHDIKPEPESEDTMKVAITPEPSAGQMAFEVELPNELEGIESPFEFQQALEGYRLQTGEAALVRRE
jgi:hypothetical protein